MTGEYNSWPQRVNFIHQDSDLACRVTILEFRMSQLDDLVATALANEATLRASIASNTAFITGLQAQIAALTASGTVDPGAIASLQQLVDNQIQDQAALASAIQTTLPAPAPATTAGPATIPSQPSADSSGSTAGPATIPSQPSADSSGSTADAAPAVTPPVV